MKILSSRWLLICLLSAIVWGGVVTNGYAQYHCIDFTPLNPPDDFCGCTWGAVLYAGESVIDAEVTLNYGNVMTETVTKEDMSGEEDISGFGFDHVYELSAAFDLPNNVVAERGDLLTWSATYGGETLTRTVRALPGFVPENVYDNMIGYRSTLGANLQQVMFAFPDQGVWSEEDSAVGYANTLAISDDTLWMGGEDGVIERTISDGSIITHSLTVTVNEIAIDEAGNVWALTHQPNLLHRYDGNTWEPITIPIVGYVLAGHRSGSGVVVGGRQGIRGAIASYTADWDQIITDIPYVFAIAMDDSGDVWIAADAQGVFRIDLTDPMNPQTYGKEDGLPTNLISYIVPTNNYVYVGGDPTDASNGTLGRYNTMTNTWDVWSIENGLPEGTIPDESAAITGLTAAPDGTVFATTNTGIHTLSNDVWWRTRIVEDGAITALATDGIHTFAAGQQLHQFDPDAFPGVSPVAMIDSATFDLERTIILSGTGQEDEPDDAHIIAWEWWSDDTLLCNSANCVIQPHEIETDICADQASAPVSFRVQDDEGEWSEAAGINNIICPALPTVTHTPAPTPTITNTPTAEPIITDTPTPEPTATDTPTPTELPPLSVSLRSPTVTTIVPWGGLLLIMLGIGCVVAVRIE